MGSGERTAELVGALSLACDLGAGLAAESGMRTAILSIRIGHLVGLDREQLRDVYYAGLLRFLGCTGYSYEEALLNGGDDREFIRMFTDVDLGDPRKVVARTFSSLARGRGALARVASVARFLGDPGGPAKVSTAHCNAAVVLAKKLGMTAGVARALDRMYERWDGKGAPKKLAGEAIDPVARTLQVGHVAEVYHRIGGAAAAREEVRRRKARHFDPAIAAAIERSDDSLFRGLSDPSAWDHFLDAEPAPALVLRPDDKAIIAAAFAHYADLKSPFMLGHSIAVADLASATAKAVGMTAEDQQSLHLAGLLHDIGRVSVANGIWDKPGPLNEAERNRVHAFPAETERILRSSAMLRPAAELACSAYERLDGSGFHRRLVGAALGPAARLLAAADIYVALTEERPYRPALSPAKAAATLADEAVSGRIDRAATRAVLDCVGDRASGLRRELPDGLSERESEVLSLLARGLSNKAIANRLGVSPRTVQTHVMHIFDKTGIRGRAAAALYAVESGLARNQHFGG